MATETVAIKVAGDHGEQTKRPRRPAVYLGSGAGSALYRHLLAARRSVTVVAPYVKGHFAKKLVELAARGVDVTLVSSEDVARRRDVAAELVEQVRHTSGAARRWRLGGLAASAVLLASWFPLIALSGSGDWSRYAWLAGVAGVLGFAGFRSLRVYSYSYRFRLPRMKVVASPYHEGGDQAGDPLMVHAKVYIVDDVAYVASFNLTPEGFFSNFESCYRIEEPAEVRELVAGVEALVNNESLRTLDAAAVGRGAYPEPRA